jgi:RNA polymerase sigma-70 factor (ECF subfamily)
MTGQGQRPDARASPGVGDAENDAAVIRRSRDEPEHFAVLFRRYAPEVQRYVRRRIGVDAADDVVAETFLAAFRQRDAYSLERHNARPGCTESPPASSAATAGRNPTVPLARTGYDPVTEPFTDRVDAAVQAEGARSWPRAGAAARGTAAAGVGDLLGRRGRRRARVPTGPCDHG